MLQTQQQDAIPQKEARLLEEQHMSCAHTHPAWRNLLDLPNNQLIASNPYFLFQPVFVGTMGEYEALTENSNEDNMNEDIEEDPRIDEIIRLRHENRKRLRNLMNCYQGLYGADLTSTSNNSLLDNLAKRFRKL